MSDSIGNELKNGSDGAIKVIIKLFGVLVYVAGIMYAEVHGYSLLIRGVDPDMVMWAVIGIVALGITALALPMGLHYSFHDDLQRYTAYAFYAVDFALLTFNAVVDYATRTSGEIPGWLDFYMTYLMPATPIIAAIGWSMLSLLDPGQRERATIEKLKAATRKVLGKQIAQAALDVNLTSQIDAAAKQMAYDVIEETLGHSVDKTRRNRKTIEALARPVPEQATLGTRVPEFIPHSNGKVVNAAETEAVVSNPTKRQARS